MSKFKMPITYFRSSSYNAYSMCPMLFYSEYVLGWRGPANIKADKGTIVHKVLEILAVAKLAHQNGEKKIVEEGIGEWKISPKSIITSKNLEDIIEKVFGWYTTYSTQHNWAEKDFDDCRKWVYKAVKFGGGKFDPRKKEIVQPEAQFDFEIDEPWAYYEYEYNGETIKGQLAIKGTIDQVSKIDDETYEITDWKTGRRLNWATGEEKDHAALMKDSQLRMYHYAAHKLWPNIKNIYITIYFINDGGPFTMCFGEQELQETEVMLKKRFKEIQEVEIPEKHISWKCRKFCHQGTTTFEGTCIKPLINKTNGHVTKKGEIMSKCEQIDYALRHRGIESVTKNMSATGHHVGHYQAPGTVEEDKNND